MTQHDKLFTLYAANIAAGFNSEVSGYNAKGQLEWFDHYAIHPTPPAQEETGKKKTFELFGHTFTYEEIEKYFS